MFGFSGLLGLAKDKDGPNRRTRGRLFAKHTECAYGPVLDLSATGMRVLTGAKLCKTRTPISMHEVMEITILCYDRSVTLRAKPVWAKPRSRDRMELGFQFVDMTDQDRLAVGELASMACDREYICPRQAG